MIPVTFMAEIPSGIHAEEPRLLSYSPYLDDFVSMTLPSTLMLFDHVRLCHERYPVAI